MSRHFFLDLDDLEDGTLPFSSLLSFLALFEGGFSLSLFLLELAVRWSSPPLLLPSFSLTFPRELPSNFSLSLRLSLSSLSLFSPSTLSLASRSFSPLLSRGSPS